MLAVNDLMMLSTSTKLRSRGLISLFEGRQNSMQHLNTEQVHAPVIVVINSNSCVETRNQSENTKPRLQTTHREEETEIYEVQQRCLRLRGRREKSIDDLHKIYKRITIDSLNNSLSIIKS